jgi:hypothetical protein
VSLDEGRRDLALTYAAFDLGLLVRTVSRDDVLSGMARGNQADIDGWFGLIQAARPASGRLQ